jgi:hypothetical protein
MCPYSGSAQVVFSQGPSQCVVVVPGTAYNFGGWFKNADGKFYDCYLVPHGDANCSAAAPDPLMTDGALTGMETSWTFKYVSVQVPMSVRSVYLVCDANANTYIDKLFLSATGYY